MSLHRVTLVAALFSAGTTSLAFAGCCDWEGSARLMYAASGCGGCGAPGVYIAPVVYVYVAPAVYGAPVVSLAPAIGRTRVAPAPIYVVNQRLDYTGRGIMAPYKTYTPPLAYAPEEYPYIAGYPRYPHYVTPSETQDLKGRRLHHQPRQKLAANRAPLAYRSSRHNQLFQEFLEWLARERR